MRAMSSVALALAAFSPTGPALAQYLWLQPAATGAEARYGELRQPAAELPPLLELRASGTARQAPSPQLRADRIDIDATPGTDLRVAVAEPGRQAGQHVLTYRQARLGRQETSAVNDLELVPTEAGGNTFRLLWKGTTVSAAQVQVDTSAGWHRTLRPAADGTVTLPTPFPGLYLMEVSARVNGGSVTLDGRKYTEVRHSATLSFEVQP